MGIFFVCVYGCYVIGGGLCVLITSLVKGVNSVFGFG